MSETGMRTAQILGALAKGLYQRKLMKYQMKKEKDTRELEQTRYETEQAKKDAAIAFDRKYKIDLLKLKRDQYKYMKENGKAATKEVIEDLQDQLKQGKEKNKEGETKEFEYDNKILIKIIGTPPDERGTGENKYLNSFLNMKQLKRIDPTRPRIKVDSIDDLIAIMRAAKKNSKLWKNPFIFTIDESGSIREINLDKVRKRIQEKRSGLLGTKFLAKPVYPNYADLLKKLRAIETGVFQQAFPASTDEEGKSNSSFWKGMGD